MMVRSVWLSVIVLVGLPVVTVARAESLRLTMDEAVARALAANTGLRRNRADVDSAEAELEASRALLPGNPYISGGVQRTVESKFGPNYGFSLSQEVEVAGQRGKRIAVAEINLKKSAAEHASVQAATIAAVKTAFIRARLATDRIRVARQGVEATVALRADKPRRREKSELALIEANLARVHASRAERELAAAEAGHEDAVSTLAYMLDLRPDQRLELAGDVETRPQPLGSVESVLEAAFRRRPDLLAIRHDAERAERQVALARREAIPNLVVSATVSRFEEDTFAGGDVGLSVPLFRPNSTGGREAVIDRDRAGLQLHDAKLQIERDVRQAWRACAAAAADLRRMAEEIVPASEENLDIERRLYERGEVGVSDFAGVLYDALLARRELLDSIERYNESLVEIERAAGGPVDSSM